MDDENALDRLLFEYLEGDLDVARTQELEARLAAAAPLRDELALWRETVVRADFPDTRRLEASLLLLPGGRAWRKPWVPGRFVFLLVLLAALHWPLHSSRHAARMAVPPAGRPATPRPAVAVAVAGRPPGQVSGRPRNAPAATRRNLVRPDAKPTAGKPDNTGIRGLQPLSIRSVPAAVPAQLPLVSVGFWAVPVIRHKAPAAHFVRRQARQVARLKERLRLQRQADAFLKGNVPYVVPLSGKNF